MSTYTLSAPAKINLTLDITGKRADGYHLLRTVMQAVALADEVTLTRTAGEGISLTLSDAALPCDRRNTAYRAAEVFLQHLPAKARGGVEIFVQKIIPQQAGLAGGSADAAAVLHGMNTLWGTPFSVGQLCEMALPIGADVPFCVRGGAALATGIGEQLSPCTPLAADTHIVLCKPPLGISTAAAYAAVDAADTAVTRADEAALLAALDSGNLAAVGANLHNAFEQALKIPEVAAIRAQMQAAGALGSSMSGSGSAVYALFADEAAASRCAERLRPLGEVFLTHPTRKRGLFCEKQEYKQQCRPPF